MKNVIIGELEFTIEEIEEAEVIAESDQVCAAYNEDIPAGDKAYYLCGEWYCAECVEDAINASVCAENEGVEDAERAMICQDMLFSFSYLGEQYRF